MDVTYVQAASLLTLKKYVKANKYVVEMGRYVVDRLHFRFSLHLQIEK